MKELAQAETIDSYISAAPTEVRLILEKVRRTIRKAAPGAEETIKYRLPTFVLHGNLVHFGAFKNHIGFYATPGGNAAFRKELSAYQGAKGSVQFPLKEPMPLDLITRMVKFRVKENMVRQAAKSKKRTRNS